MSTEHVDLTVNIRALRDQGWPDDYAAEQLCRDIESALRVRLRQLRVTADICAELTTPPADRCQCCDCGPIVKGSCPACNGKPCDRCGEWMHADGLAAVDYDAEAFCSGDCHSAWKYAEQRKAMARFQLGHPTPDNGEMPI